MTPPHQPPALSVEGLSGGYGRLSVFRDARVAVAPGETVGILGPNGAGKTTLLKTVTGLLPAAAGRVSLLGREMTHLRPSARVRTGLAMVPEGRQIITDLTVGENLALSRAARRLGEAAFRRRHDEVLTLFPRLAERLRVAGGALSGGEQQMLAIGRALLLDPAVLLLDEPTQGLAPIMVRQMEVALLALKARLPLLIVEQNRPFLEAVADRFLSMRDGALG